MLMMEKLVETDRPIPDLGAIQEKVVAKRFDDALTDLSAILRAEPDNPDALYMARGLIWNLLPSSLFMYNLLLE